MKKEADSASRKAKVTPETKEEAQKLRALWETRSHENQTLFGEKYEIGNQSAVGQFLRGETPLSLKAASGFAKGLGCRISDFSPRLVSELLEFARYIDFQTARQGLSAEESALIDAYRLASPNTRAGLFLLLGAPASATGKDRVEKKKKPSGKSSRSSASAPKRKTA